MTEDIAMNIIQRELDSIRPYAANAKKHDATQVANVADEHNTF